MSTPDQSAQSAHTQRRSTNRQATRYERLRKQRRLSFRRWLQAHFFDIERLLRETRTPLIGFLLVMACGTFYWRYIKNADYSTGGALFETMRMLALEHDAAFPDDMLGQFLFFAIPIFGLAFVFQGVLDFGRLLLDKTIRIEDWQDALARTHRDHVIVCGLGSISYGVVLELLETGYEVVVVEKEWQSEFVAYTLDLKVPVVHGDAIEERDLMRAGLWKARSLVAATSEDLLNIKIGLEVRRIRPDLHVVLRVFNDQLDSDLEESEFGPNTVFSSSALAAPTLAAAAACRGIKYGLPLADTLLGITDLTVESGGLLENTIDQIERQFQVQVIGYRKALAGDAYTSNTWHRSFSLQTQLHAGDHVLLLSTLPAVGQTWKHSASHAQIRQRLQSDIQQHLTPTYRRVIVCGLGSVGYRVVKELYRLTPRPDIVVIYDTVDDPSERSYFLEEVTALGIPTIPGDARRRDLLYAAGILQAYSVVAVTADKLYNVQICLNARQIRKDLDLVLRVFSDVLANQLSIIFGIHTTYSSATLASTTMAAAAVVKGTGYTVDIGDQLMSTATLKVCHGDEFIHRTIQQVRQEHAIVVLALRRDTQRVIMPADPNNPEAFFDQPLQPDDEIIIMAEIHQLAALQRRRTAAMSFQTSSLWHRTSSTVPTLPQPTWQTAVPSPTPTTQSPAPHFATQHWLEQLQRTTVDGQPPDNGQSTANTGDTRHFV